LHQQTPDFSEEVGGLASQIRLGGLIVLSGALRLPPNTPYELVKLGGNSIDLPMAKLPDPIITNIFVIQRRIIECIDATTATEFRLFERMGETSESLPELEELQNIRERLLSSYSRLNTLLLGVAQSQPIAAQDMINLLYRSVETGQATLDASIASLQEIQRNWN
jgi:hypothetical protein